MIEINLLPGKKKAAAGAGFKLRLPDIRGLVASVTNPWLLAASLAWVLLLVGGGALFVTSKARLAVLNSRLQAVQTEKQRFDAVIAQKRQSEKMRDSLLSEITVIRRIDADRYVWPHILDQVTKALPPYSWLNGISSLPAGTVADTTAVPAVRFTITGSTVDIQAYTTFLRQLAASPWFTDVMPASSQTVVEQDRPVTAFTVTAHYRIADSVYIHTVPLTQAVR
jgi:Tfp pilus assembly protein PilN